MTGFLPFTVFPSMVAFLMLVNFPSPPPSEPEQKGCRCEDDQIWLEIKDREAQGQHHGRMALLLERVGQAREKQWVA